MLAAPMVCKGFRSLGSKWEEPSTPEPSPAVPYQPAAAAATDSFSVTLVQASVSVLLLLAGHTFSLAKGWPYK